MGSTTFRTRASLCLCRLLLVGLLGLALWPLNLFAQEVGQASQDQRPNVLVLFADDMTYEALGSLELIDIETPNLDRLAARGTTFTRAYNMGSWSGAVCIASRTMLMTGRYVWSANAIHASTDEERKAGRLWPQLLAASGYDTYMTGKWHVNTDAAKCFDTVRHIRPGMPRTVPHAYNRPIEGEPDEWSSSDQALGGFWEGGKHWSEVAADDAIEFLEQATADEDPFLMYVAFNAPHDPRQAPEEFLARYPLERMTLPENFLPEYPYAKPMGCGPDLRDESLAPFPRTPYAIKVHRREYYALITHLDQQIGRILDRLEATGLDEQTIVIFTADHGLAVGRHGLLGKQNLYEHSVRVPFIMAGPGIAADRRIDAAIYLQDIVPTTLETAGVPKPEQVDFHSLWPLLREETQASAYPDVYGAYLQLQRSITSDGWKLIVYPKAKALRLYHLAEDPKELHDRASEPEQAERKAKLFEQLIALQRDLNDSLDLSGLAAEIESQR